MNRIIPLTRRQFLKGTAAMAGAAITAPMFVPASVLGADAPSKKIQIGQIGCGRIAHEMDLPGILRHDVARIVTVCDVDSKRTAKAKERVEKHYASKTGSDKAVVVKASGDYREWIKDPGIDAVSISTPDFWHAEPIIAAALAGKDVYVQKPLSMTIAEGRAVSDVLKRTGRAFQIGSQQRSDSPWPQFRRTVELVRNGQVGKLHTVRVGLPTDPSGKVEPEMPVPPNLDYDMWLGCTPVKPYTENRVHPQNSLSDRPGWLRIEAYTLGMITGWGSHHLDIAHWGMDTELTGPIEAQGRAEFPRSGLWDVHGPYHIEMKYANGVTMIIDNTFPNGVRFEGSDGWIFVSRGSARVTASDPDLGESKAFAASDPKILRYELKSNDVRCHASKDHHLDWLQSIQTRKPAATTPEQAHRSTSACEIAWIAMKLGRKLRWDPVKEEFIGDAEANSMRSRPERAPYGYTKLLKS